MTYVWHMWGTFVVEDVNWSKTRRVIHLLNVIVVTVFSLFRYADLYTLAGAVAVESMGGGCWPWHLMCAMLPAPHPHPRHAHTITIRFPANESMPGN